MKRDIMRLVYEDQVCKLYVSAPVFMLAAMNQNSLVIKVRVDCLAVLTLVGAIKRVLIVRLPDEPLSYVAHAWACLVHVQRLTSRC